MNIPLRPGTSTKQLGTYVTEQEANDALAQFINERPEVTGPDGEQRRLTNGEVFWLKKLGLYILLGIFMATGI